MTLKEYFESKRDYRKRGPGDCEPWDIVKKTTQEGHTSTIALLVIPQGVLLFKVDYTGPKFEFKFDPQGTSDYVPGGCDITTVGFFTKKELEISSFGGQEIEIIDQLIPGDVRLEIRRD